MNRKINEKEVWEYIRDTYYKEKNERTGDEQYLTLDGICLFVYILYFNNKIDHILYGTMSTQLDYYMTYSDPNLLYNMSYFHELNREGDFIRGDFCNLMVLSCV